jgi:hypothetical protein
MGTQLTQVILPNAQSMFWTNDGIPLAGGFVYFYEPGTTTFKDTWQDIDLTVPNDNPVQLDASGRAQIWGNGIYRQIVTDSIGNLIWDGITSTGFDPTTFTGINVAYDLPVYMQGKPSAAEVYPIFNIVRDVKLPIGLVGSIFTIGINPTAPAVWTLKKNGTSIGTVTFDTSGIPTISFLNEITFAPLDQFTMTAPGSQDATAADFAATVVFTVVTS